MQYHAEGVYLPLAVSVFRKLTAFEQVIHREVRMHGL